MSWPRSGSPHLTHSKSHERGQLEALRIHCVNWGCQELAGRWGEVHRVKVACQQDASSELVTSPQDGVMSLVFRKWLDWIVPLTSGTRKSPTTPSHLSSPPRSARGWTGLGLCTYLWLVFFFVCRGSACRWRRIGRIEVSVWHIRTKVDVTIFTNIFEWTTWGFEFTILTLHESTSGWTFAVVLSSFTDRWSLTVTHWPTVRVATPAHTRLT